MARKRAEGLTTKDRVVAVRALPGVAEGTAGRIELVNGLTWIRYWVEFDTGVWLGSIDSKAVVAEADWPDYQERRAAEAVRAAEEAARPAPEAAPVAAAAPADAPADEATSTIPAALLARSQAAKAKKAAAAAAAE